MEKLHTYQVSQSKANLFTFFIWEDLSLTDIKSHGIWFTHYERTYVFSGVKKTVSAA
jgi:hypothetical protein